MNYKFKSFDIIISKEKEKNVSYLKRLINAVSEKVGRKSIRSSAGTNFLKMYKALKDEETRRNKAIRINSRDFDFEFVQSQPFCFEVPNQSFNLMSDFEQLVKLLSSFCEEPKREKAYEIEITFELPKPKKLKKVTTYDKITIFERWVKIGYKMYRRQFDSWTGDSYIVVDGDVYNIKCDRYGREYLA